MTQIVAAAAAPTRDEAFAAYVAARQKALLRTAVLLTGGDRYAAEDLLQSALARLYLSWGNVRQAESIDAYVRRTMINLLTSWWRRAWRRREVTVERVLDSPTVAAGGTADLVADRDAMWRALQRLSSGQRAVVVLRFYEDLTEAQTAEVLGCAVGTVKSQTNRALARLREQYVQEGGHP